MRSLLKKSKALLRHSGRVKEMLRTMPETAAGIQDLVAQATSTIQQLRVDADSLMGDLKVENEAHFGEILREVSFAQDVLLEAGYIFGGASISMGSLPAAWSVGKPALEFGRLTIHLERTESPPKSLILPAAIEQQSSKTLKALFHAIQRAQDLADNMHGLGLVLDELLVTVGPLPSIKIVWSNAVLVEDTGEGICEPRSASKGAITPSWSAADEGFFPERPRSVSAPTPAKPVGSTFVPADETVAETVRDDPSDPLAKFKKMPNLKK
jgi:hypothetical protein